MNTDIPNLSDTLAMGHPVIDGQHRMLVHMIRELRARVDAGEHRQGVLDALQGMLAYAATHFEDEEEIMEEAGWEGLERHEGLHAEFMWKAGDLHAQVKDDCDQASRDVLEYLYNWLMEHILVEDRSFFTSFRA